MENGFITNVSESIEMKNKIIAKLNEENKALEELNKLNEISLKKINNGIDLVCELIEKYINLLGIQNSEYEKGFLFACRIILDHIERIYNE